jgi:hypothetical protein
MIKKIISILLMLVSGYFILRNKYLGLSLIIFMASSIYFGYAIREGKGKEEVGRINLPPPRVIPQPLQISLPRGYGEFG